MPDGRNPATDETVTSAAPALDHARQSGRAEHEHRPHEDVEHPLLGRQVAAGEPLPGGEPRVVDQQVDRARGVAQPLGDPVELGAHAQVGGDHLDLHPVVAPQLIRDRAEVDGVARHEHQTGAAGGEGRANALPMPAVAPVTRAVGGLSDGMSAGMSDGMSDGMRMRTAVPSSGQTRAPAPDRRRTPPAGRRFVVWADVALVLAFIMLGGLFAAAEMALVSLRPGQVSRLAQQGRRGPAGRPSSSQDPTASSSAV